MSTAAQLESWTQHSLSRLLAKTVARYLKDEEHRREFEEWYFAKYGKKYQWRKGGYRDDSNTQTKTRS